MNRDYPMQTTVGGEDAPILGSVLPFPEEGEGEHKMDEFPAQTTIEGEEEKSDFEDYCFDITQGLIGIIIITMLAFIVAFMVYGAFVAVHRVAWGF